jgi:hypothetical protein
MLQKSTGSYRRAGPVNRGGAAASDKAVVDLEEGAVVSDSICSGEGVGERWGAGVAQTATGGGSR